MAKLEVAWQKGKGKVEDSIIVTERGTKKNSPVIGPFAIPARFFHDMARAGVALLRENHYGTFLEADEISLEIKKAPRPEDDGLFIVDVYINDNSVLQLWCDHISKWGDDSYTFNLKGQNICGIGAKKVKFSEELKGFDWKPSR